jgi:predicted thioesterase
MDKVVSNASNRRDPWAVGLSEMVVRPGDTSVAIGLGDLPVIAPSLLINLMEHAAILSLDLFWNQKRQLSR